MLTVVDRPLIQHVVDEAREAGIEHFIFVTGRNKGVIEDHFDRQFELEHTLASRNKRAELDGLERDLPAAGRQFHPPAIAARPRPCGLVRARTRGRRAVRADPAGRFGAGPPKLPRADDGRLSRARNGPNVIAVEEVPPDRAHMYGVVGLGETKGKAQRITEMVEKPPKGTAPSNQIITGRYILQPEIFDVLAIQERGAGGEIQLTDAMITLARRNHSTP